MQDLNGKKLLILGASHHELDLIRRCKELGVYTIVTDYYSVDVSPAKKVADEAWFISWSDIDALEAKCKEASVDGVTGGYSEFVIENVIKLCDRLGLPCYCTQHQLDVTRDKILFKDTCKANGVPTIREYPTPKDVTNYPVIVKPTDRAGSIGISVASNPEELEVAYNYAMDMSVCKKVIIEDFIHDGSKFDVYYAITDGKINYITSSDTINARDNGYDKVVQSGWLCPSKYQNDYLLACDASIKKMIQSLNIQNGYIFFSGFKTESGFAFFECGFRLSGEHLHRYAEILNLSDVQDIFIYHALSGSCEGLNFAFTSENSQKCAMINYYAKKGVISSISGTEEIENLSDCGFSLISARIGQECKDDKAILAKVAMFHFYNGDVLKLDDDIRDANRMFTVFDENGNDMIYDRVDDSYVSEWYKN